MPTPLNRANYSYLCWFILLSLLFLLTACKLDEPDAADNGSIEADADSQADYVPDFEEDTCPFELFEGDHIRCGYLYVPEVRSDPDSREVELAVAILASRSSNPKADPILYLEGGPGGSALADPDSWLESPLLDERDIILLDQRGTGFSLPSLNCIELEAEDEQVSTLEAAQACRDRLENEGVNLAAYNSAASAADIHDLRLALGYEEWNLLGISYGTRLGLTVMRDAPQGIRSVILDSVYPPNINAYTDQPLNNADAIQALLDGCAANKACHEAYPTLSEHFYELIDELNDAPYENDEDYIDGGVIIDTLVSTLYDTSTIPELPFVINEAYYENYEPMLNLMGGDDEEGANRLERRPFQDEDLSDSEGQFYSVECHEEVPFGNLAEAKAKVASYPPQLTDKLLADLEELFQVCGFWGAGEADPIEAQAVQSPLPTLLLAGEYDPVTPPSWAKLATTTLAQHYYFEIPAGGHSLTDAGDCPLGIIIGFLNNPLSQPDGSCIREIQPHFALPD